MILKSIRLYASGMFRGKKERKERWKRERKIDLE
jgi:hypothetical protein